MKDYGLVSIITPAYNCADFIAKTIESVRAQTYNNWELLITDDCSTDGTRDIVARYIEEDSRIHYFCLAENSGAGVARNNSIEKATGRYLAFIDSDDMWMPHKLETQLAFMEEMNCAVSGTSYLTIDEADKVTGIVVAPRKHTFWQNKCDDKIGFSTCMYDTAKIGKQYMPHLRKRQDWGLKMKLLSICKVAYEIKEPLGYYRKGHDSLSKNKYSLIKYHYAAYMEVLGWGFAKAFLFFWMIYLPSNLIKKVEKLIST